ncbi:MAG: glycosyltransferase family 4 protein [Candidatus Acidiferrum sp.]
MKILVAHNVYQHPGGEDAARDAEIRLLREAGHHVVEYVRRNDEIRNYSFFDKANLAWRASWSSQSHRELRVILARESPDAAHFHNTFPLISPSAYYACREAGVAIVQTLHNFRLLCPGGNLFQDGHVCEECISHSLLRSIAHGCYHESRGETAAVAAMLAVHRQMRTWADQVDLFLVCTEFARGKFLEAGFRADQVRVKPNFIASDPGVRLGQGVTALFMGRLSPEKGPQLLPRAWSKLALEIPLQIVGDGPLRSSLEADCTRLGLQNIHFSGWLGAPSALGHLRAAKFLIIPSICYENFPLVLAEAYACGIPVIAAGHGGLADLLHDGVEGLQFAPGDENDLAAKIAWAWSHPEEMQAMGRAARAEFESKYTAGPALAHLESAYEFALRRSRISARAPKSLVRNDPSTLAARREETD